MNVETEEYPPQKNSDIIGDDTVIDTENLNNKTNKTNTTEILEFQEYDEVLDDDTVLATGTTEITNNDTAKNKIN